MLSYIVKSCAHDHLTTGRIKPDPPLCETSTILNDIKMCFIWSTWTSNTKLLHLLYLPIALLTGDIGVDIPSRYHNGGDKKAFHFTSLLPCAKRRANSSQISMNGKNNENLRTVKPLLNEGRANNEDDDNSEGSSSGRLQPSAPVMAGSLPLDRQESVPIQASSWLVVHSHISPIHNFDRSVTAVSLI